MNEIPPHLMEALARAERAKDIVMRYPYYTDAQRDAWLDAIDGHLDVQVQAYKNAREALEEAFSKRTQNGR